jgi:uncharacterized phage-associated protein
MAPTTAGIITDYLPITADVIADFIICRYRDKGEFISHLKLQRLVYYVQAWYLALYEQPLFVGPFEAWIHGPVVRSLYSRFKDFSWQPITEAVECPSLPNEVEDHVLEVLKIYGDFTAEDLEYMVHRESPWILARGDSHPLEPSTALIDEAEMMKFYQEMGIID